MNQYDREFGYSQGQPAARTRADESGLLLSRVCFLTLGMVVCTALGAAVFWVIPSGVLFLAALVATFVMLFVCRAVARKYPANLAALAVFAGLEGMVIAPLLMQYAHLDGPLIIGEAAVITFLVFGMVGTLGYTSARSYANWIPWLFGALFLMIIASVVMIFWAVSPAANWLYSVIGTVLFVAFTFVDFTRIRHNFSADDYVIATMEIYLDLINLFLFILRLLGRRR